MASQDDTVARIRSLVSDFERCVGDAKVDAFAEALELAEEVERDPASSPQDKELARNLRGTMLRKFRQRALALREQGNPAQAEIDEMIGIIGSPNDLSYLQPDQMKEWREGAVATVKLLVRIDPEFRELLRNKKDA